jgi:hypothetical protein
LSPQLKLLGIVQQEILYFSHIFLFEADLIKHH